MKDLLLILKALSDRNRLRIFNALLRYDELCACQITELLQIAGATASRHLSLMVAAGILKSKKVGRWVHFSLDGPDVLSDPVVDWIKLKLNTSDQIEKDLKTLDCIMRIPCEELSRKQREKTKSYTTNNQEMIHGK